MKQCRIAVFIVCMTVLAFEVLGPIVGNTLKSGQLFEPRCELTEPDPDVLCASRRRSSGLSRPGWRGAGSPACADHAARTFLARVSRNSASSRRAALIAAASAGEASPVSSARRSAWLIWV